MAEHLKGRVALVSGAGRGIAKAVATLLAEEGAAVVVSDLGVNLDGTEPRSGPADETVQELTSRGLKAVAAYDDIATWKGAHHAVQIALDNFGRIDIMAHVAGVLRDRMFFNMTEEEWDIVLRVHLSGGFYLSKAVAPHMIKQRWGRIFIFSSGAGLGRFGGTNYGAAKEGDLGLVRALSRELGPYGITVNNLRPGANTRMTESIPETTRQRGAAQAAARGVQRVDPHEGSNTAENNAPKLAFLCTDAAKDINGQDLNIGGWPFTLNEPRRTWRSIHKPGRWTLDELDQLLPFSVTPDLQNPSPPQESQPRAG